MVKAKSRRGLEARTLQFALIGSGAIVILSISMDARSYMATSICVQEYAGELWMEREYKCLRPVDWNLCFNS